MLQNKKMGPLFRSCDLIFSKVNDFWILTIHEISPIHPGPPKHGHFATPQRDWPSPNISPTRWCRRRSCHTRPDNPQSYWRFKREGRRRFSTSSRKEFSGVCLCMPHLKKLEILIIYLIPFKASEELMLESKLAKARDLVHFSWMWAIFKRQRFDPFRETQRSSCFIIDLQAYHPQELSGNVWLVDIYTLGFQPPLKQWVLIQPPLLAYGF